MDPLTARGTTAQLVVRGHLRRTGWLYALAARPRARRLLRVLGLTYVPARDEPIQGVADYVVIGVDVDTDILARVAGRFQSGGVIPGSAVRY